MPDVSAVTAVSFEIASILREKSGAERLRLAHEAWEVAHERPTAFLAATHPESNTSTVRREVARRASGASGSA